jgi:hypothetical protein
VRELTTDEKELIARRKADFDEFRREVIPILLEFVELYEFGDPAGLIGDIKLLIPILDDYLRHQEVSIEHPHRLWLMMRVGYVIARYLIQEEGGSWSVNDIPDSRYFGAYVVWGFNRAENKGLMIDPFVAADIYLRKPPGRSLAQMLRRLSDEIRTG